MELLSSLKSFLTGNRHRLYLSVYIAVCVIFKATHGLPTKVVTEEPPSDSCRDPEHISKFKTALDPPVKLCYDGHLKLVTNYTDGSTHALVFQNENRVCPNELQDLSKDGSLNSRSLCPTDNVTSIDENRIPRVITIKRCLCDNCLSSGENISTNQCEPVLGRIQILKRQPGCGTDGFAVWAREQLDVPVACVCAVPQLAVSTS